MLDNIKPFDILFLDIETVPKVADFNNRNYGSKKREKTRLTKIIMKIITSIMLQFLRNLVK